MEAGQSIDDSLQAYFSKWCCLIIDADHGAASIYSSWLEALKKDGIGCTIHFYYSNGFNTSDFNESPVETFEKTGIPDVNDFIRHAFDKGFRKVMMPLAGFLPPASLIREGFSALKMIEFCLCPDAEGRCCLIGMNYFEPSLFENFHNEPDISYKEAVKSVGKLKLSIYKLPMQPVQKF